MEFQAFTFPEQQYSTLSCGIPSSTGLIDSNNPSSPQIQNIVVNLNNVLDFSLQTANCSQEDEQVWLVHKNNTFELLGTVNVDFLNLGDRTNFYVSTQNNAPQRVASLQVVINAIKETNSKKLAMDDSLINQKIKGDKNTPTPVQIFPLANNSTAQSSSLSNIKWSKLFFSSATSGNGKSKDQQGYFRVMISLVATIEGGVFVNLLSSVISPKLIVIGSNPGRFKRTKFNTLNPVSPSSNINTPSTPINSINILANNVNTNTSFSETISSQYQIDATVQPTFTLNNDPQFYDTLTNGILSDTIFDEKIYSIPPSPQLSNDFEQSSIGTSPDGLYSTLSPSSSDQDTIKNTSRWHRNENGTGLYAHGNIGINLTAPLEALSVGGNILVTGNLFKPSDKRIKQNFTNMDTKSQLQNIKNLRIYNYERMEVGAAAANNSDNVIFIPETGFIAQEVNQIMPNAVKTIGNVNLPNGKIVEDMLVVNDHALLVENIGATQELVHVIDDIEIDLKQNKKLIEKLTDLVDSILKSEKSQDGTGKKSIFGHGMFNLGPAWTMTILGFFIPIFWLVGLFYMFSERDMRQRSGVICLFLASLEFGLQIGLYWALGNPTVALSIYCFFWSNGMMICLIIVLVKYYQQVARRRNKKKQEELIKDLFVS
eukprot:TRINITY_DN2113_c0_g1_i3.p1 TRINITY_DN2113_c0_g1~~TRINITY_DN2113_c0_g1_i3.p1  ORF type:complete len:655 (-),score=101.96 TRINITY_DN2113_c0_g1_i3:22-1986(-)